MNDIFGYTWEQIQAAQRKEGRLSSGKIDLSKQVDHSLHAGDRELLAQHGIEGLRAKGFMGVIDRLEHNGLA